MKKTALQRGVSRPPPPTPEDAKYALRPASASDGRQRLIFSDLNGLGSRRVTLALPLLHFGRPHLDGIAAMRAHELKQLVHTERAACGAPQCGTDHLSADARRPKH